jgi:tetratricopeptide (TPR) repeat protein
VILLLLLGADPAQAQKQPKLHELQKLTVGPEDNYQGFRLPGQDVLVYTQLSVLSPRIYKMKLGTDHSEHLLGQKYDAKDPRPSPDGKRLAFIYYRNSSRGDVCTVDLSSTKISCLHAFDAEHREPFWLDDETLGFVGRHFEKGGWYMAKYHLPSNSKSVLYQGEVSSPAYLVSQGFLVFAAPILSKKGQAQGLYMQPQKSGASAGRSSAFAPAKQIPIGLPGISGFPQFAPDGKYLYFTQFMSDSNQDGTIDGRDHGVVFRLSLDKMIPAMIKSHDRPLIPEQMTAVEQNCSYPNPDESWLYVTCANGGSLDVYRLPLSGLVPAEWGPTQLDEAFWSARQYERRTLLTNVRLARSGEELTRGLHRLFFDHMQLGEFDAAQYYLDLKDFVTFNDVEKSWLRRWIELEQQWYRLSNGQLTPQFRALASAAASESNACAGSGTPLCNYVSILAGFYLGQDMKASFQKLPLPESLPTAYFYNALMPLVLKLDPAAQAQRIYELLGGVFAKEPMQLFWMDRYLTILEKSLPAAGSYQAKLTELVLSSSYEQVSKAPSANPFAALVHTELLLLSLIESADDKLKQEQYNKLNTIMLALKGNIDLSRAIYVRSLTRLGQHGEHKFLQFVANNWLRLVDVAHMEFDYVMRQFRLFNFERGYANIAESQFVPAQGIFFGTASGIGDLEAYYQFGQLSLKNDGYEATVKSLSKLEERGILLEAKSDVQAMMQLLNASAREQGDTDFWRQAIDKMQVGTTQVQGLAMRYLLIGYAYVRLLDLERSGYKFDKEASGRAHYYLSLALDLAQDNRRLKAAALENLGYLHGVTRNFGASAHYYQMRWNLGFDHPEDRTAMVWILSKVWLHARQHSQAVSAIEQELLQLSSDHRLYRPLQQRLAFHAILAGEYERASGHYEKILATKGPSLPTRYEISARLSLGFAYKELGRCAEATQHWEKLVSLVQGFKMESNVKSMVALNGDRFLLQAYGFLAQCAKESVSANRYRDARRKILKSYEDKPKELGLPELELLRHAEGNGFR